ncbi:hypothetical protein BDQ12DRAFT_688552 [Crucibulum laeve]|uniref:Uncharacterized protein n=1 Tax=Crucibulum laeve TaxID=68775 RepID=A0A5C3LQW3_9AGAR|nr:hypothetical protein BDQ12DRAFT_688552 [Crucibulum laeve]
MEVLSLSASCGVLILGSSIPCVTIKIEQGQPHQWPPLPIVCKIPSGNNKLRVFIIANLNIIRPQIACSPSRYRGL